MSTTNQKLNEGFFDVMMKVACEEIMDKQIAEWDALNTGEHKFSPEFERKMKKLMRGQTRKLRMKKARKVLSRAAIVILVVMAIGFTFTMSVEAVRVQFINSIREFAEEYIGFSFSERNEQSSGEILRPAYLPEGYDESDVQTTQAGVRITYRHSNGKRIILKQQVMLDGTEVRIDGEHISDYYVTVYLGVDLQVYEGINEDADNYIIWEDGSSFFQLSGSIESSELLEMAKSILS
jgi:hypothetical protein